MAWQSRKTAKGPPVGSVFGKRTVIGEIVRIPRKNQSGYNLRIPCRCACGKESLVRKERLLKEDADSCSRCWGAKKRLPEPKQGDTFGMWTVIGRVIRNYRKGTKRSVPVTKVPCQCVCGDRHDVFIESLRTGMSRGCLDCAKIIAGRDGKMTRLKHGGSGSRLYRLYQGMLKRCNSPTATNAKYYYDKGIKVCEGGLYTCLTKGLTHSRSLFTLFGMLDVYAKDFGSALHNLREFSRVLIDTEKAGELVIPPAHLQASIETINGIRESCLKIDCDEAAHLAEKLCGMVQSGFTVTHLHGAAEQVMWMIVYQLGKRKFYYVPIDRVSFYECEELFGEDVSLKFKSAIPEIKEAGACYALGRSTACVFHLMRVIPHGMRALIKKLNVKYTTPIECMEWNRIIDPINKAVRDLQQLPRSSRKFKQQKEYSEIVQHLYFCKDAWRNHVSHSPEAYDMPQARSVMDHVGLVMRLLIKLT